MNDLIELFCNIDDFWKTFKIEWDQHLLSSGHKKRGPSPELSMSEMMTIIIPSSLFIKKPERIMGLLMVMTLALLVYSIAQRNVRLYLEKNRETLPNQIKKETTKPTLRWIFQLMEGIELVQVQINETVKFTISGLTTLRMRILTCFSTSVKKIYGLAT